MVQNITTKVNFTAPRSLLQVNKELFRIKEGRPKRRRAMGGKKGPEMPEHDVCFGLKKDSGKTGRLSDLLSG